VVVDSSGNVYVADLFNHCIRKITEEGGTWTVSTLAGKGTRGHKNGAAATARLSAPIGVAVDSSGNVYVADLYEVLVEREVIALMRSPSYKKYAENMAAWIASAKEEKPPRGVVRILANALKERRKKKRFTQRDLAKEPGVSICTIRYIEQQKMTPSITTLKRLAKPLCCKVEDLVVLDWNICQESHY